MQNLNLDKYGAQSSSTSKPQLFLNLHKFQKA